MAAIAVTSLSLFVEIEARTTARPPAARPEAVRDVVQVDSDVAAVEQALEGDPVLMGKFEAALQTLERFNPKLARAFARQMRKNLDVGSSRRRQVDIQVRVSVQQVSIRVDFGDRQQPQPAKTDPIVLDLDGNGIRVTGIAEGAVFDIDADGHLDRTSWVTPGDVLLALDRNRNGRIDDGSELFGDQRGAVNGFEELRKLDDNRDGVMDAQDGAFGDLVVLSRGGSLASLAEVGVAAVRLDYRNVGQEQRGTFVRTNGARALAADVLLDRTEPRP